MAHLSYISDAALVAAVTQLLAVAGEAVSQSINEPDRNKIDPFGVLFEMAGFNLTHAEWKIAEQRRQAQKTLTNAVGDFHQHILGSIPDWTNLGTGAVVDLVCNKLKFVAEVKNKHNTVKGTERISVYDDLAGQVATKGHTYYGYTAYYVEIIPSSMKGYDKPFTPSDKKTGIKRQSNSRIRVIDGRKFYALATGVPDALDQLHHVLPTVIESCSSNKYKFADSDVIADFFQKVFLNPTQVVKMKATSKKLKPRKKVKPKKKS